MMKGAWESYFSKENELLRQEIRGFTSEWITPQVNHWEEQGSFPKDLLLEREQNLYHKWSVG